MIFNNIDTLQEYCHLYGYGNRTEILIGGKHLEVLPLAHPRQIGALGAHSERWHNAHLEWEKKNGKYDPLRYYYLKNCRRDEVTLSFEEMKY